MLDARRSATRTGWVIGGLVGVALLVGIYELWRVLGVAGRQERLVAMFQERMMLDATTGLLNHRAFQRRLRDEMARAQPAGERAALIVMDVDHFREVNEALGHQEGDRALVELSRRLRLAARAEDVLGRTGGNELGWLMVDSDADGAMQAAERLRAAIAEKPLAGAGHVTASFGVCSTGEARSARELLRLAEGALYWAKSSGRDRVHRYWPESDRALSAEERISALESARSPPCARWPGRWTPRMPRRSNIQSGWQPLPRPWPSNVAGPRRAPPSCTRRRCCTTSGRSASRTASSSRPGRPPRPSGPSSASTQFWARASWTGPSSTSRWRGYVPTTSATTARGTRTASPADIPEGSRLIAVAWDVMLSDRPYAPPAQPEAAREECRRHRGSQFDPAAVDALEGALARMSEAGARAPGHPVGAAPDAAADRRRAHSHR